MKATRRRPELEIQKALADHLRLRAARGIHRFHPANGGARNVTEGRVSPAQMAAHDEMRAADAEIAVAVGIDAPQAQRESWGLLRGRSQ
jgi:hypothetical protein